MQNIRLNWQWKEAPLGLQDERTGRYVVGYEGEGTLQVHGSANNVNIISSEEGKIVFENETGLGFSLRLEDTDPQGTGNYIKNIFIVKEEFYDLYMAGEIFYP